MYTASCARPSHAVGMASVWVGLGSDIFLKRHGGTPSSLTLFTVACGTTGLIFTKLVHLHVHAGGLVQECGKYVNESIFYINQGYKSGVRKLCE